MDEIIFAVEIDVACGRQWLDFLCLLIELALPGFEGDDGGDGHSGRVLYVDFLAI